MLDFVVMSRQLSGLVKSLKADTSVPFAPHFGLKLKLRARPQEVQVRQLSKAIPLFKALISVQTTEENKPNAPQALAYDAGWTAARIRLREIRGPFLDLPTNFDEAVKATGLLAAARRLGQQYAEWSAIAEFEALLSAGASLEQLENLKGRGALPVLKEAVLPDILPLEARKVRGGAVANKDIAWWSMISKHLMDAKIGPLPPAVRKQMAVASREAGNYVPQDAQPNPEQWKEVMVHGLTSSDQLVTFLAAAMEHLGDVQKQAAREASASFKEWLASSLLRGAGPAHASVNLESRLPKPLEVVRTADGVWHEQPVEALQARATNWSEFWCTGHTTQAAIADLAAEIRRWALDEALANDWHSNISASSIDKACETFSWKSGV
jgi:hypothetical protein